MASSLPSVSLFISWLTALPLLRVSRLLPTTFFFILPLGSQPPTLVSPWVFFFSCRFALPPSPRLPPPKRKWEYAPILHLWQSASERASQWACRCVSRLDSHAASQSLCSSVKTLIKKSHPQSQTAIQAFLSPLVPVPGFLFISRLIPCHTFSAPSPVFCLFHAHLFLEEDWKTWLIRNIINFFLRTESEKIEVGLEGGDGGARDGDYKRETEVFGARKTAR